jgi:microcystin-dependent protein
MAQSPIPDDFFTVPDDQENRITRLERTIRDLARVNSDLLRAGVVGSGDGAVTALAVSGAGDVTFTAAAGVAWVSTSGFVSRAVISGGAQAPALESGSLPIAGHTKGFALEIDVGGVWHLLQSGADVTGVTNANGATALSNADGVAPAAGRLRMLTLAISNNAGVYSLNGTGQHDWRLSAQPAPLPGVVEAHVGAAAPFSYLLADGSAVSRFIYSALFAAAGTTYGAGDGATTFNLPDIRSRSIVGAGAGAGLTNRAVNASGGEENHLLTAAESGLPQHNHGPVRGAFAETDFNAVVASGANLGGVTWGDTTTANAGPSNAGSSHNNMHPWRALNYIIRA